MVFTAFKWTRYDLRTIVYWPVCIARALAGWPNYREWMIYFRPTAVIWISYYVYAMLPPSTYHVQWPKFVVSIMCSEMTIYSGDRNP